MAKKHYFILTSDYSDDERVTKLRKKAESYYNNGGYEEVAIDNFFTDALRKSIPNGSNTYNASLLLIGSILTTIAQCDSVYVANDWEDDDICKICHMLSFSHGVDLIYESV